MTSRRELAIRWHRFQRDHGVHIFLFLAVGLVLGLVVLLMYLLAIPEWRPRE
jgi:cell division septal protein FtsQ